MTDLWELPAGWHWMTMGEVATVVGGSTPKTGEPSYWGGDIPWITPDDLSGFTGKYIERGRRSITQAGYDSCSAQMVPAGTVLFTSRAPIGYVAIAANPVCTNQGFKSFVCGPEVQPGYVYWWLRASRDLATSMASGTTFPELSGKAALRVPIPVPPLADQGRIVEAIEEQDSRLDAATASLRRGQIGLRQYADATLEAVYRQRSMPGSDPRNGRWPYASLGSLLGEPLRNGHSAKRSPHGTVRTLTLTAVTRSDFSEANTKLTEADPAKVADLWLRPGDILIERSNTPELVGTASMYRGPENFAVYPDLMIRARLAPGPSPDFVELMIRAPNSRRYFRSKAQGIAGTMPKIDQSTVANLPIPLPPRDIQDAIVRAWQEVSSVAQHLEAEVSRGLRRALKLREQVYRSAFRGELV